VRRVLAIRPVERRGGGSRSLRLAGCLVVLDLWVLSGCGDGTKVSGPGAPPVATPAKAAKTIAVRLQDENRSGAFGTATLRGDEHAISVTLQIEPADRRYQLTSTT
jgi:hypothetical protein